MILGDDRWPRGLGLSRSATMCSKGKNTVLQSLGDDHESVV